MSANDVRPGMTLLLDRFDGGYSDELGWTGDEEDRPTIGRLPERSAGCVPRDPLSSSDWYLLTSHLRDAEAEARALVDGTGLAGKPRGPCRGPRRRWHDVGKNQPRWRDAVPKNGQPGAGPWAKFPSRLRRGVSSGHTARSGERALLFRPVAYGSRGMDGARRVSGGGAPRQGPYGVAEPAAASPQTCLVSVMATNFHRFMAGST